MSTEFACPQCRETYAQHWLADDGSGMCRSCADDHDGRCKAPGHPEHTDGASCYIRRPEQPGDPCRWCARPVPEDGSACPHCWLSLKNMPLADIRALFVADGTFETTVDRNPGSGT